MKHCAKGAEPPSLRDFRTASPSADWNQLRGDRQGQTYSDIKRDQLRTQGGLCAYCEQRLATALDDASIAASTNDQQVEHYHPKSDRSAHAINWALMWDNLWVACLGGATSAAGGVNPPPHQYLEPVRENLSCGSFKKDTVPEGIIMAPHDVPLYPHLFAFDDEGKIRPAPGCDAHTVPGNSCATTADLVKSTIEQLNLNCTRLCNVRSVVWKRLRDEIQSGIQARANPRDFRLRMARKYLTRRDGECWREYFTLFRESIGPMADEHLRSTNYAG